jgi:iron complex outermembrane receptor protein
MLLALDVACQAARAPAQPAALSDTIEVVGTTPLGSPLSADRLASNAETVTAEELRAQGALDLSDFMKRRFASVFVNEVQSNPLQPDVQYRGFVGSPLLGLPQGLAVYQDGVRANEPFGDTVNWALIPDSAIESATLLPGANPLFGLNALGGVIAIDTKTGFTSPGTRAEVLAGSFGRASVSAETGGTLGDGLGYFATASWLDEDGWRDFSATNARQVFAKLSSQSETTGVDVSFAYADTDLIGNGAAPIQLLEQGRSAIYTHPDRTENLLHLLNVRAEQSVGNVTVSGNLYVRGSDIATLNGDEGDFAECDGLPGFICRQEDGGEALLTDAKGEPIEVADALLGATLNRTATRQNGGGFNLQTAFTHTRGGSTNTFTIGLAQDSGRVAYTSSTELGALDDTRLAVGGGVLVGDAYVDLTVRKTDYGLFVTDTFSFAERVTLTVSGRYNRTHVVLEDALGDELSGDHTYGRFNPAIGVTFTPRDGLGLYAQISEASRAPSPVELTCADEEDPCRLPNAFVADPPLEQVVARTLEAGARGRAGGLAWHAGAFRSTNYDDILFVSAGTLTSEGYFTNVGKTRRDGIEINLSGEASDRLRWFADYTYLDATFLQSFTVSSPNHPFAVNGEIPVERGARLPLVPNWLIKLGIDVDANERLTLGFDVFSSGAQHYRGDEGNLAEPIDPYTVLNAHAEWRINERLSVFASADNLLDERFATFGTFGAPSEVLGEAYDDPRFLAPSAPRAAWVGVRLSF